MVAKYFVWGSGAWRELDMSTGAVRGWRRQARFVFVRRGRLQLARRRPVLRALRALARDQPSAAADGPRLAHLRQPSARRVPPAAAPAPPPHCCAHHNGCISSHTSVSAQREAGVQCGAAGAGPGGGVTLTLQRPAHSSGEEFVAPRPRPGPRSSKSRSAQLQADTTDLFRPPPPVQDVSEPKNTTEEKIVDSKLDSDSPPRAKRARVSSSEPADELCKELVVSEEDLAALRGFVARSRRAALARFDADECYRRALCYAINPLVTLSRCDQLERLQRLQAPSHALADTDADKENKAVSQESTSREARRKPRPTVTGRREKLRRSLRVRPDAERERDAQDQRVSPKKAPPTKQASLTQAPPKPGSPIKAPPNKVVSPTKALPAKPGSPKKTPPAKAAGAHAAISNRPSAGRSKEYSSLEDHCIVSWLESGNRASKVNGNRLWQDLQEQYPRLTGQERTWHSLRNRYLRYILPALGALGLPPPHVSRLRAAAATGYIKRSARRASIFRQEPVRSASALRPRPQPAAPGPAPGPQPATPGPAPLPQPATGGPAPRPQPAAPGPAPRLAAKQGGDKSDASASRSTRRSRGQPDAGPPAAGPERPSAGKASGTLSLDARDSPSLRSRARAPSKRERPQSPSPSPSSSSEEGAPLKSKDDNASTSRSTRRSRGQPDARASPPAAGKASGTPALDGRDSPSLRSRARAPGKRERPQSPSPSPSSSSDDGAPLKSKDDNASTLRSTRRSRGQPAAGPERPSAGKASSTPALIDGRDSPSLRSRARAPSKRERPQSPSPSPSPSSSSEEGAPLRSKDNTRAPSPRRARGRPPGRRESAYSPTPSASSSDHEEPSNKADAAAARRRSLRYSDVTRTFAARHRPAGSDSSGPAGPARPARTTRTARPYGDSASSSDDFESARPARSRKLFNPNAKL